MQIGDFNSGSFHVGSISSTGNENQLNIKEQALQNGKEVLNQMSSGETLRGEVISVNQGEAFVRVGDNAVVSARLDSSVSIQAGQNIVFEVLNASDGQVGLRALFTNLAQEQVAFNALESAGIAVNNKSLQMVADLMKEGMPIDKSNLASIYRDILSNPDINQSQIVQMNKIGLEVTEANAKQYSAMCNYEQSINQSFSNIVDEIPEYLKELASSNPDEAVSVTNNLLELIKENTEKLNNDISDLANLDEKANIEENNSQLKNTDISTKEAIATEQSGDLEQENLSFKSILEDIPRSEKAELYKLLKESGFSEENLNSIKTGQGNLSDFINEIQQSINEHKIDIKSLLDHPAFEKIMSKGLMDNFKFLNPEEIDKDNVTSNYQKLTAKALQIAETLSNTLSGSESITSSLNQFSEQLDFMNALNQFLPYVQLPVKLNGEGQTGDLYVLANKKKLSEKNQQITALLHLNMTELGNMDIFVKLKEKNITTNFTLEKEEIIDFLEAHMDELNARLEKRGFHSNTTVSLAKDKTDVSEEISNVFDGNTKMNEQSGNSVIEYLRFDVRA